MRKVLIYGALLAAALVIPTNDVELGKMKPVETVSIRMQEGKVFVETDTEDSGVGSTLEEALQDLKETTAGVIYLDTADYLIVDQKCQEQMAVLLNTLKPNMRICLRSGDVDMKTVSEFLREHTPEMKLKNWKPGEKMQVLEGENGRMKLKQKSEKSA